MKKIIYVILAIILAAMFVSNTSEAEFVYKIDNSKDPEAKFFMHRVAKNSKAIIEGDKYYSPVFVLDFTNLGLFSVADMEWGWMGTLRRDGKVLDKYVDKVFEAKYILIFGREFEIKKAP